MFHLILIIIIMTIQLMLVFYYQNGNYNYKYESLPTIDNGIFISLKELYLNSQIDINIKMYIGKLQEYEPYTGR